MHHQIIIREDQRPQQETRKEASDKAIVDPSIWHFERRASSLLPPLHPRFLATSCLPSSSTAAAAASLRVPMLLFHFAAQGVEGICLDEVNCLVDRRLRR